MRSRLGARLPDGMVRILPDIGIAFHMFLRNQTTTVSLPHMFTNLARGGAELAVLVGPGDVDRFSRGVPFPVLLARDKAVRYDAGPDWPCEGVANVFPLQTRRATREGCH